MNCPECRHPNSPSAKFCAQCGAAQSKECPRCGALLPLAARFCQECGISQVDAPPAEPSPEPFRLEEPFAASRRRLPGALSQWFPAAAEGENRLVTVLFADMSSSVRTMGDLHPEEAAALVNRLLQAMVEVLAEYEGRVDRFLGDGLLAVFGVPQARENDPVRAIQAALAIRSAARDLGFETTAGINTGEVYVGAVGSERHREVTVMGPVVNLAARLQEHAEPGEILVGGATGRLARSGFRFAPVTLGVKGIEQPVAAYRVEGALARPRKARGVEGLQAALIGRDAELARLMGALEETRQGRGQVVSLSAEAGVGKSRLVAELKRNAGVWVLDGGLPGEPDGASPSPGLGQPRIVWLEGWCSESDIRTSYSVFVDLLREFLGHRWETGDVPRSALLERPLRALVSSGELPSERYAEVLSLLGNMLSIPSSGDGSERLKQFSAEQVKHLTFRAMEEFLVALSRRQPLVLVLEDLHWADSLSLELISVLMEAAIRAPICLLCVYRLEPASGAAAETGIQCRQLGTHAARNCAERYQEIHLNELTPAQTRQLAESLLTADTLPARVWDLILQKARGNPLFVEEVVRSLIAAGMIYREETDGSGGAGPWRAREGIELAAVPDTIQSVILSRVDRLEPELTQVLQCAAIVGRSFDLRILERLAPKSVDLRRSLAALEEHGLVYQIRSGPEEEYAFKHVLTQETVYETILRRRRKGLHRNVAETIEGLYAPRLEERCEALAHHYARSDSLSRAIEYLLMAGQKAMRMYANEEAIRYFEQALECGRQLPIDSDERRWQVSARESLGDVFFRTGAHRAAEAQFQEALALAPGDRRSQASLAAKLADTILWQYSWEQAVAVAEAALTALGDDQYNEEAVRLLEVISRSCRTGNDLERAQQFADRLKQILPRVPYFDSLYMVHYGLAIQEMRSGNLLAAQEWLQVMEEVCGRHHNENGLARCFHGRGDLACYQGDHKVAADWLSKSLDLCERTGDSQVLLEGHAERARALARIDGDPREIEMHVERMMSIARGMATNGGFATAAEMSRQMADAYYDRGDDEHAVIAYRRALDLDPRQHSDSMLHRLEQSYLRLNRCEEFFDYCRRIQVDPLPGSSERPRHWRLVPGSCDLCRVQLVWEDCFTGPALGAEWKVMLPEAPTSGALVLERGLLHLRTLSLPQIPNIPHPVPRLLRQVSGDFAAETVLVDTADPDSHTAGLLLWTSEGDFLMFGKFHAEGSEVSLKACGGDRCDTIGRGCLPGPELHLLLVRHSGCVSAWSSRDGTQWFCGAQTRISDEDSLQVGPFVAGGPPRSVSAGHFQAFRLYRVEQQ